MSIVPVAAVVACVVGGGTACAIRWETDRVQVRRAEALPAGAEVDVGASGTTATLPARGDSTPERTCSLAAGTALRVVGRGPDRTTYASVGGTPAPLPADGCPHGARVFVASAEVGAMAAEKERREAGAAARKAAAEALDAGG